MTESRCCRTYRCEGCGKTAARLSESWSTTTFLPDRAHIHRCLECRSVKRYAPADGCTCTLHGPEPECQIHGRCAFEGHPTDQGVCYCGLIGWAPC